MKCLQPGRQLARYREIKKAPCPLKKNSIFLKKMPKSTSNGLKIQRCGSDVDECRAGS